MLYIYAIVKSMFLFNYELKENIFIVQYPFENRYRVSYVTKDTTLLLSDNAFGWYLSDDIVYVDTYGIMDSKVLFLETLEVKNYGISPLNEMLVTKGLPRYDISNLENTSDIAPGMAKDRMYKQYSTSEQSFWDLFDYRGYIYWLIY